MGAGSCAGRVCGVRSPAQGDRPGVAEMNDDADMIVLLVKITSNQHE